MKPRALIIGVLCLVGTSVAVADWRDDIGYTALQARLGSAAPTGAGIGVTQVEAKQADNYMPDVNNAAFAGKAIQRKSGPSGVSSHATSVGAYFYGTGSPPPSVAHDIGPIDVYHAFDWYMFGCLNATIPSVPLSEIRRIENHSWTGATDDGVASEILRRLDLLVDRDGVTVVVGVNNGAGSGMPKLLGPAYNALAVGLTNGQSSYGPTTLDSPGRVKPDLVAPAGDTSWATPMVSSSAALLLQAADADNILSDLSVDERRRDKALLVKALLMAGATKTKCANWRKGFATASTDGTVPLDYRYGAGELSVDNSHRILTAGQQRSGTAADIRLAGWDCGGISAGSPVHYFFDVPSGSCANPVSILLTWNRHIDVVTDNRACFYLVASLANIDLHLFQASVYTARRLVDQSVSTLDNVEHIYLTNLAAGRYVFELTSDQAWTYAIAWDIALAAAPLTGISTMTATWM